MTMSRKDFEIVAAVLRRGRNLAIGLGPETLALVNGMVEDATRRLANDNPHFQTERFRAACQEPPPPGRVDLS